MGALGTKEHERFVEAFHRRDAARVMREHLARHARWCARLTRVPIAGDKTTSRSEE